MTGVGNAVDGWTIGEDYTWTPDPCALTSFQMHMPFIQEPAVCLRSSGAAGGARGGASGSFFN